LAKLAYVLIVLHVGAALKHHLVDRDSVLVRMAPFLGGRSVKGA
jgi:cytochrome b561